MNTRGIRLRIDTRLKHRVGTHMERPTLVVTAVVATVVRPCPQGHKDSADLKVLKMPGDCGFRLREPRLRFDRSFSRNRYQRISDFLLSLTIRRPQFTHWSSPVMVCGFPRSLICNQRRSAAVADASADRSADPRDSGVVPFAERSALHTPCSTFRWDNQPGNRSPGSGVSGGSRLR